VYTRSGSLQVHLFGYLVSDIILLFTLSDRTLHVFCTAKRMAFFSSAGTADPSNTMKLKLHEKAKGAPEADAEATLALIKAAGLTRVGVLSKDKPEGQYAGRARKTLFEDSRLPQVDVMAGTALALQIKDAAALESMRHASALSALALHKVGYPRVARAAAEGKALTHAKWAQIVEQALSNAAEAVPGAADRGIAAEDVELALTPLLQSGAAFDAKPFVEPSDAKATWDTLSLSVGARYRSYCGFASRSVFVRPTEEHESAWDLLLAASRAGAAAMVAGGKAKDVHDAVEATVRAARPEWVEKLTKTCGAGIGLEFREAQLPLSAASTVTLAEGMALNLSIALSGLKPGKTNNDDGKRKDFSVFLADTYVVRPRGTGAAPAGPECLTDAAPRDFTALTVTMPEAGKDDDESGSDAGSGAEDEAEGEGAGTARSDDRRSRAARAQDEAKERQREEEDRKTRQRELAKQRASEALLRYADHDGNESAAEARATAAARVRAYADATKIPTAARPNRLTVDRPNKAVLVPINGQLVPFHVSLIKAVRHSQVGAHYVLRITFQTPDAKGSIESLPPGSRPEHAFLKEVSFRTKSPSALAEVHTVLETMRKEAVAAKKDAEASASGAGAIVEQPPLRVLAQASVRLRDVACHPAIGSGTGTRKSAGMLTAHQNGFRYMTKDRDGTAHVDIIYENIKGCFVQRATARDEEVVLHIELKNAIKIGASNNKRSAFLQFFYKVVDSAQDVSTASSRYDDEEEMRAEREEEQRRKDWNQRFMDFATACDRMWEADVRIDLRFESPFRKLMFTGVVSKENVDLFPTTNFLIALKNRPKPLVLSLTEIELASLERVNFNQREFDIVLVFKDYARTPEMLTSVPLKYLEAIKIWLSSVGVLYHEFPANIRWAEVLPEILKDVRGFFDDGGWSALVDDDDEDAGSGGSGSDSESAASASEYEISGSESSESDDFTSDDESGSESGSDSEEADEDDEDALDWDELEAKTRKEEKAKLFGKGKDKKGSDSDSDSD